MRSVKQTVASALSAMLAMLLAVNATAEPPPAADQVYVDHCLACHGQGRLGGSGPALLPENLGRLKPADAAAVIAEGRTATQMPGFADVLTEDQISALVQLIFTPLPEIPSWGIEEIEASRIIHTPADQLPDRPVHSADPLNLFTVVETGDQHVTILDGDRFQSLWRFPSRYALHGGAKYSPDGRFVYLGSRDGWVSKYDLFGLVPVAEVRAGINLRNIAVSADGLWVMAGNYLPHSLVILDAGDLRPVKHTNVESQGRSSRVSAVYTAPPRQSFVAALKDVPEMWEISYEGDPEPVASGTVHNYQADMLEGAFDFGPFPVRRIALDDYLDDFFSIHPIATPLGPLAMALPAR